MYSVSLSDLLYWHPQLTSVASLSIYHISPTRPASHILADSNAVVRRLSRTNSFSLALLVVVLSSVRGETCLTFGLDNALSDVDTLARAHNHIGRRVPADWE